MQQGTKTRTSTSCELEIIEVRCLAGNRIFLFCFVLLVLFLAKNAKERYTCSKVVANTVSSSTDAAAMNIILLPLKSIVRINECKVLWQRGETS